jgi:hypothetical protein
LWGWHARQPLVTAVVAPLQLIGVYSVVRRWKSREQDDSEWGSRSIGSIALIGGVMLASLLVNYPICAGRVTLFARIHLQILAVEGALFVLARWSRNRAVAVASYLLIAVVLFHSIRQLARFVRAEPEEDLRPVIARINREAADTIWVHPCSVAQVRSLPDPLPAGEVLLGTEKRVPPRGARVWIIWSHLGEESCRARLEQLEQQAEVWEVVHTGPGRGLALAEFETREQRKAR